jgi:hypothetical protein
VNRGLIFILIGLAVIGGAVFMTARGIRNNNPGNIRHGASKWVGMAAEQPDAEYVTFTEAKYGIRAMAKLLRNYQTRYNLNTVHSLISRWAPPDENLTAAYIQAVSQRTGFPPALYLNLQDEEKLIPLVDAIIHHENGSVPYSTDELKAGIALA